MLKNLPKSARIPLFIGLVLCLAYALYGSGHDPAANLEAQRKQNAKELALRDQELQQFLRKQYGGESTGGAQHALVMRVGKAIAARAKGHPLAFHLLADANAINSFGFPSGDVYVTVALVNRMKTEGELAAVLAEAAAHAQAGHHLQLPEAPAKKIHAYRPDDEAAIDTAALRLMADAGYSPAAMVSMFGVLSEAYHAGADAQFFTTHPSAEDRLSTLSRAIESLYPEGIPAILSQ